MVSIHRSTAGFLLLLFITSVAFGQAWPAPPAGGDSDPAWGITDETAITVSSFEMLPYGQGVVVETVWSTGKRYIASAPPFFSAAILPLEPPRGAIITRLEAEGCNDTLASVAQVVLSDFSVDAPQSITHIEIPPGSGCGTFSSAAVSHIVGISGPYGILWTQDPGPAQRLALVRVYYKLQMSLAPETATFADVPVGSALHQYVEALAAAGITVGCGGGNFCPNAPATRGQIAVFLAKALGLHWAP